MASYNCQYRGYNPNIIPDIKQAFVTAAFRFGHTLVRNRFERVNSDFSRSREGPLTVQESFNNNHPILNSGLEPIVQGLFGNNAVWRILITPSWHLLGRRCLSLQENEDLKIY